MLKHHSGARTLSGALLIIALALAAPAHGAEYEWGLSLAAVKKAIPAGTDTLQFAPSDDPEYENKIMSYITAIDADFIKKITIVRVRTRPVKDYLFVNDKLYTVMENWGEVEARTVKEIESGLSGQYGTPLVQQDKSLSIYSYNNDKTKVLYYQTKSADGASKCTVYYYTRKLFRLLIME